MKVKAATEKNFRRARAKPAKGRGLRRLFSWRLVRAVLLVAVVAYAGHRAIALVLNASVLKISRIVVRGNSHLTGGEVQQLAHDLYGRNILVADLAGQRRAILDSPWVAEAALRRVLPSTVEIAVVERRPAAIGRIDQQLYLIDREGTIIDDFGPQYSRYDLPIVDGLVRKRRGAKPSVDPARAELAARVIDALAGTPLARRLSQIDVTDARNAVVLLEQEPAMLYVGTEKFRERLQSYLELAPAIRENLDDVDYVDLRFGERVFARGRSGGAARTGRTGRGRQSD